MSRRALEGYEKALGRDHTSTLDTVNNLGNLYTNQGRLPEAESMYQRALSGFQTALGPSHWKSQLVLRNMDPLQNAKGTQDCGIWIHCRMPKVSKTRYLATSFTNVMRRFIGCDRVTATHT
jgi:tetratricopeptide (TPR) repeat protein